jgi:hypothetical protein
MQAEKRERWIRLCVEAADEQESNRFLELTSEINRLLHEKEMRLRNVRREATGFVIEAEKKGELGNHSIVASSTETASSIRTQLRFISADVLS